VTKDEIKKELNRIRKELDVLAETRASLIHDLRGVQAKCKQHEFNPGGWTCQICGFGL
jgi:rubrerythrin